MAIQDAPEFIFEGELSVVVLLIADVLNCLLDLRDSYRENPIRLLPRKWPVP